MGTWSTTAPTNLASEWTTMQENSAQGGYRVKISGNYVYLYYNCIVRACSAWLETGQLCVKVENYSCALGGAAPSNSLSTNAYITNESDRIDEVEAQEGITKKDSNNILINKGIDYKLSNEEKELLNILK